MTSLNGRLEHITFRNEDNGYTIAKLRPDSGEALLTVVGHLTGAEVGATLRISGQWAHHPRFGPQFKIESFEVILPTGVDSILKYLQAGTVKSIGKKMAVRIVRHFQEDTLKVIESAPQRLCEVEGIGTAKAERIHQAWNEQHAVRNLMRFLQNHGVNPSIGGRILKLYGDQAVDILSQDPFRLADALPGIGFVIADTLARGMGAPADAPQRITACLHHLMAENANDGNTCLQEERLLGQCERKFEIDSGTAGRVLAQMAADGDLVKEMFAEPSGGSVVFDPALHHAERNIGARLKAMLSLSAGPPAFSPRQIQAEVARQLSIQLSEAQMAVLQSLLSSHIGIITGGPGTGKTTLIRSITAVFRSLGQRTLLAAPTGRAARRLGEVARHKAQTLHKLLRYNLNSAAFDKGRDDPLETDVLIVDEASMVDTVLMSSLLDALPLAARLILVGDVYQLPSVGPGNILDDLIASGRIETFELKEIFRQHDQSPIIEIAHHIRQGERLIIDANPADTPLAEFNFIQEGRPESVVDIIVRLCRDDIPRQFGFDPINDIQVLTPMHKGVVGTIHLNNVLQAQLNPLEDRAATPGGRYRVGDKVMHLKNNYQKEVFNGDIGTVAAIDRAKETLRVHYESRDVEYDLNELDEISKAYAISVHKSQGSEYPAVVIPLLTQHFALLQRNVLYTAVTRGTRLVVLVGTHQALKIALGNDKRQQRLTGLKHQILLWD